MLQPFENIIWDWNGTLLNDQEITMQCINRLLESRNLSPLTTEGYRKAFGFPIKDYYKRIGFDFGKDDFSVLANEFIVDYYSRIGEAQLHSDAHKVLQQLKEKGINLFVLSAMEHQSLLKTLEHHNILSFFTEVSGLDNHHAASKTDNGLKLMTQRQLDPDKTVLIGDTNHDAETAQILGCQCILFSQGHQNIPKLSATNFPIINSLSQLTQ